MAFYLGRKAIRKVPGAVIKAAPLPESELIEGFGARGTVGELCEKAGFRSVLVVTDQTLYGLGLHEKVTASLETHGIPCALFHEIDSEPTVRIVDAGRRAATACGADCIVALGGGSVLDSGKIIAAGAKHPNAPIKHYLHKFAFANHGTLPMINIPSTAGTGAECTVGAVVKNKHGAKSSTVIIGMEVPYVILDSELLIGAPQSVTTWCAIDALSHGLEGLLADVDSSEEDIEKSRACVKLVLENLPVLLQDPKNVEARQATLLAAHYGGNAINTQLAGYVHAFAHSIGALYHIPHGKAIAWCLVPIVEAQEKLLAAQAVRDEKARPLQEPGKRRFLDYYDRLRKKYFPVVFRVREGNSCPGCHMVLPASKMQQAQRNAKLADTPEKMNLVACDYCGRLIFK